MHIPVPWMFVVTYLLGVLLESIRPVTIVPMQPRVSTIVGFVLFALGALIAGWGWMIFHKAGTTTIPGRSSLKAGHVGTLSFHSKPNVCRPDLRLPRRGGITKTIVASLSFTFDTGLSQLDRDSRRGEKAY
jgi:hypothetical protein